MADIVVPPDTTGTNGARTTARSQGYGRAMKHPRGQSMVEFALVFPLFMLMLFGIVDLSRYVYTANALSEGVRQAARQASVGRLPDECSAFTVNQRGSCVTEVANNGLTAVERPLTITTICKHRVPDGSGGVSTSDVAMSACKTADGDHLLHVTASAPFTLVTPLIAQFIDSSISATVEVTVQ